MKEGTWTNGKQTVRGWWEYLWAADKFVVELDSRDRITGQPRRMVLFGGDSPEWGKWKLVRNP